MNQRTIFVVIAIIIFSAIGYGVYSYFTAPSDTALSSQETMPVTASSSTGNLEAEPVVPGVRHMATPDPVKALYVSSWIAATPSQFERVLKLIDETEANAVVLDIKDATGRVSFLVDDPIVKSTGSPENRIKNISALLERLHEKNIYIIGRISTFQDPYLAKVKPEWAIAKKSDGSVWRDRKGLAFLDPANPEVAEYLIALGRASFELGFDEINYDYIRYPSDGAMNDIDYKLKEGETRADHITQFSQKLHNELKQYPGLVLSADLFGLTTTERTDMGIGQVFEQLFPYFDYIAPMIYPSHYNKGEYGIKHPAEQPYETIMKALAGAKNKVNKMASTTTVNEAGETITVVDTERAAELYKKIRPWLQDFSINGVTYDAAKVRAQIQATYDSGLTSWMMWDPSNKYTTSAYQKEGSVLQ